MKHICLSLVLGLTLAVSVFGQDGYYFLTSYGDYFQKYNFYYMLQNVEMWSNEITKNTPRVVKALKEWETGDAFTKSAISNAFTEGLIAPLIIK